jgi:hypothetical protein
MEPDDEGTNFYPDLRALLASDLSETEKLAQAFAAVTGKMVESARRDIELAAALGDGDLRVKHQIKMESMEAVRGAFQGCYRMVTGRRAWNEQNRR